MSKIVNRFNRKTMFLIAFLILPIRAFFYTLVDNPYLLLLIQTLDGMAAGILGIMATLINSDLALNTGRFNLIQGLGAMSVAIGESMSLLTAGIIANFFGFTISFLFLASAAIFGIVFFAFFMPETKRMNQKAK